MPEKPAKRILFLYFRIFWKRFQFFLIQYIAIVLQIQLIILSKRKVLRFVQIKHLFFVKSANSKNGNGSNYCSPLPIRRMN